MIGLGGTLWGEFAAKKQQCPRSVGLFIKLGSNVGKMPDVRPLIEFVSPHTPLIDAAGGGFRDKARPISDKIAED